MPRRLYYSLLGGLHPPSTNPSSEDFQATAKKGVTVLTEFFELQADFPRVNITHKYEYSLE